MISSSENSSEIELMVKPLLLDDQSDIVDGAQVAVIVCSVQFPIKTELLGV